MNKMLFNPKFGSQTIHIGGLIDVTPSDRYMVSYLGKFRKRHRGVFIKRAIYASCYSAGYKTICKTLRQDNPRKPARLICKVARELVTTYSRI